MIKKSLLLLALITLLLPKTAMAQKIYAKFSADEQFMTIYYDNKWNNREGTTYTPNETFDEAMGGYIKSWRQTGASTYVTQVYFDESLTTNNYRPKSCEKWFQYFTKLTHIVGLERLNTADVTDIVV